MIVEKNIVAVVAKKVIKERTNGNIGFVSPFTRDSSNVPGILNTFELKNTIISKSILPIKPAIRVHKVLISMSVKRMFLGPNDIVK